MTLLPELEQQAPASLMAAFADEFANDSMSPEEHEFRFDEAAIKIAASGEDGVAFLLEQGAGASNGKLHAILLGLSFAPRAVTDKHDAALKKFLTAQLSHRDALVVAQAVDSLAFLGYKETEQEVLPLLEAESPIVVGSALRFLSRLDSQRAKPELLRALHSPSPVVRQNGIDELDALGCIEALPRIRALLTDDDADVRQAAEAAVANLTTLAKNQSAND